MVYQINKAVVIGAGTMGAAIAAHLANAGVAVTLLDIVPGELTKAEEEKGLTLDDKMVRNRIVQDGLTQAMKAKPANFMSNALVDMVQVGNLEDDLEVAREADWVIEVIVENLKIKQDLMSKLDDLRKANTIVSTNTSGIPIASIAEGRSDGFKKHFLGTHFFNPPRYLNLLELIPGPDTLPEVMTFFSDFGERRLGKGIVLCKDTPNFIGNRVFSVDAAFTMDYVMKNGYSVPEVDAITGPLLGRPKTATFRLLDLIGVDIAAHVNNNLAPLIPDDKLAQPLLTSERAKRLFEGLIGNGWLGKKVDTGFYKMVRGDGGKKEFWHLNLETLEHEPPGEKVRFDSIGKVREIDDDGKRIKAFLAEDDRAAQLARAMIFNGLSYVSSVIPEIADTPKPIDDALRWGFAHKMGFFEIWDALGVAETVAKMKADGFVVADWVDEMVAAGIKSFYQIKGNLKVAVYSPLDKGYVPIVYPPVNINLQSLKDDGKVIEKNIGATFMDLGDGIGCVEFHTKMNAIDSDIGEVINKALDCVATDFDGLVVGNDGEHFSAGANIFLIAMLAQQEQWDELNQVLVGLQNFNMRMRYFPKPVVVAPFGYTLGGGAEVAMHGNRIVAAAELYTGLVELGVGVIPAGGGTKEMMRRVVNPPMQTENADPLPYIEKVFMQIGTAKVATSAVEALEFGILGPSDRIVMNRGHLLAEAKREARHMADMGYVAPVPEKIYAGGRDMLAALRVGIYMFHEGKYITDHDVTVAGHLANILAGGNLSKPEWVSEQYVLDLEREAFLSLCGEEKTQARLWHMLQNNKPLRN